MASLTAASVSYKLQGKGPGAKDENSNRVNNIILTFGDGTSTYPTGGIPLVLSKYGAPNSIDFVDILDTSGGGGYVYTYNRSTSKLMMFYAPTTTPGALVEVASSVAPASGLNLLVQVSGH
jgi:hypothetical protein